MIASATLNFDDKIVYLSILDGNQVAVVDQTKKFSILEIPSLEKEHDFTLKHAYTHVEKKSISFSPDGKYLAYSETEQSVVRVIDIQAQKLHHSFPTLQNNIETLCFDPSSNYLIAGSLTGRVFLWNLFSTGQVSRLSSFPEYSPSMLTQPKNNYVSAACFSPSGNLVATTGYGGSIVITNIHTEVSTKRITPSHVRINSLCFVGEDFICAGNIEGGVDHINLQTGQIQKHYQSALGDINTICLSHSGRFLFLAGHTRQVSIIDLVNEKILSNDYIRLNAKVTRMSITKEDVLLIGCENGCVHFFNLYPEELLQLRLDTSAYTQAHDLLQKFPLLEASPLAQDLENAWEQTLNEAISRVQEADITGAQKLLKRFEKVPSKTKTINDFKSLITHYQRFRTAVAHKNYALAYSMSDQVSLLKKTDPYREAEEVWDSVFLKAQAYIIKGTTNDLFKLFEPFSRVSAKLCFIQVLLHQPEKFLEFTNHINDHSYDKIFTITQQYPCLKEIQSYQKVLESSQELLIKCRQHIYSRDYELAEFEQEALSHVSYLKEDLHELSTLLNFAKKLEKFYQEQDYISAYTLLDKHHILKVLPLSISLEEVWNTKMKEAEKEALLGHTKEIKNILQELLSLHSRAQKVGMLIRLSYIIQIKMLIIKERYNLIEASVYKYIHLFGFDTELQNLLKKLQKSKNISVPLTPEQEYRRPRTLWLSITDGKIPDTIYETL